MVDTKFVYTLSKSGMRGNELKGTEIYSPSPHSSCIRLLTHMGTVINAKNLFCRVSCLREECQKVLARWQCFLVETQSSLVLLLMDRAIDWLCGIFIGSGGDNSSYRYRLHAWSWCFVILEWSFRNELIVWKWWENLMVVWDISHQPRESA